MTKMQDEMLALADKIEYAIKTEGEITLFETNGIRMVYALRALAAQSAGEPPIAGTPQEVTDEMVERAWSAMVGNDIAGRCFNVSIIRADLKTGLSAALSVPPGDQARACDGADDRERGQ